MSALPYGGIQCCDEHEVYRDYCEKCRFFSASKTRLHLVPVSLAQANEHVAAWHRHNDPVIQCVFRVGAADDAGVLRAVAIVEAPKGRENNDGATLEVTRVASDGTRNACSLLYGACARAAFALGYRRLITYTRSDESGSSLRAAGYRLIAERPARPGWHTVSRPRDNARYESVPRQLWEFVTLGAGQPGAGVSPPEGEPSEKDFGGTA